MILIILEEMDLLYFSDFELCKFQNIISNFLLFLKVNCNTYYSFCENEVEILKGQDQDIFEMILETEYNFRRHISLPKSWSHKLLGINKDAHHLLEKESIYVNRMKTIKDLIFKGKGEENYKIADDFTSFKEALTRILFS